MKTSVQNHRFLILLFSFVVLWLSGCDKAKPASRVNFKIAFVDSLAVVYDEEAKRLPEKIQELCAGLEASSKDCERMYVLDPTLLRLDLNKELFLKTTIEKGGAKNTDNPKVVNKLIKKHLKEIDVPKEFTKGFTPGKNASLLVAELLTTKAKNDSVLVFSEGGALETYTFNNKSYRVFSDIDELRKHMLNTLCQNDKVNFTLLMNPPEATQGPTRPEDTTQTISTTTTGETIKTVRSNRKRVVYRDREPRHSPPTPPNGICDYTTHTLHEKVVDAAGKVSRGKVLVMNCAECGYQVGRR